MSVVAENLSVKAFLPLASLGPSELPSLCRSCALPLTSLIRRDTQLVWLGRVRMSDSESRSSKVLANQRAGWTRSDQRAGSESFVIDFRSPAAERRDGGSLELTGERRRTRRFSLVGEQSAGGGGSSTPTCHLEANPVQSGQVRFQRSIQVKNLQLFCPTYGAGKLADPSRILFDHVNETADCTQPDFIFRCWCHSSQARSLVTPT